MPHAKVGYSYLLREYLKIVLFAVSRMKPTKEDLFSLRYILLAPLLYLLRFKGELRTPVGRLLVTERGILRSFTYGFFKSHFAYLYRLRSLLRTESNWLFPVIVDVGANIGDFTLCMRRYAKSIVAVEPGEQNFQALCRTLQLNGISNVIPIRVAAHNQEKQVFLEGQSSNMYVSRENKGESVKGEPLDLITRKLGIEKIDILKIDVQGHERSVLSGSSGLLQGKLVKLLIVELHLNRGVSVREVISLMESHGYSLVYKDRYLFGYEQPQLYFSPK